MATEYEIKFQATPAVLAEIEAAFSGDTVRIFMETTYYDTPSGAFAQRRWTLRRRKENGVSVCTLKTPAGQLGRREWELSCGSIEAAIPELCKLSGLTELAVLTREGLIPVCGARFTRQAAAVTVEATEVEIALDRGILFAGDREIPLWELEVELKEGSREQAAAYALALAHQYGLEPEPHSKFKRALALREEG